MTYKIKIFITSYIHLIFFRLIIWLPHRSKFQPMTKRQSQSIDVNHYVHICFDLKVIGSLISLEAWVTKDRRAHQWVSKRELSDSSWYAIPRFLKTTPSKFQSYAFNFKLLLLFLLLLFCLFWSVFFIKNVILIFIAMCSQ